MSADQTVHARRIVHVEAVRTGTDVAWTIVLPDERDTTLQTMLDRFSEEGWDLDVAVATGLNRQQLYFTGVGFAPTEPSLIYDFADFGPDTLDEIVDEIDHHGIQAVVSTEDRSVEVASAAEPVLDEIVDRVLRARYGGAAFDAWSLDDSVPHDSHTEFDQGPTR